MGLGLLLSLGCGSTPRERNPPPSSEWKHSLDDLESRLVLDQSRVRYWEEMAVRHRHISEVTCENQNRHLVKMALAMEKQEKALREKKRRRRLKPKAH